MGKIVGEKVMGEEQKKGQLPIWVCKLQLIMLIRCVGRL